MLLLERYTHATNLHVASCADRLRCACQRRGVDGSTKGQHMQQHGRDASSQP
jgi:hypothetical protein